MALLRSYNRWASWLGSPKPSTTGSASGRRNDSVAAKEPPFGHHFVVRACGILISVGSEIRDSNTPKSPSI